MAANVVGDYKFNWNVPDAIGTYVLEVGLVPQQLSAHDFFWLAVA